MQYFSSLGLHQKLRSWGEPINCPVDIFFYFQVFKHTFDVIEDYFNSALLAVGAISLSVRYPIEIYLTICLYI